MQLLRPKTSLGLRLCYKVEVWRREEVGVEESVVLLCSSARNHCSVSLNPDLLDSVLINTTGSVFIPLS